MVTPLLAASLSLLCATAPAPAHDAAYAAWREERVQQLAGPRGLLTLVGQHWLAEGESRVGAAEGNTLRLPDGAPPLLGTLRRTGGRVHFTPAEGAEVSRAGKPFRGGAVYPAEGGAPAVLTAGTLQLVVMELDGRVGVWVRDPEAPARKGFQPPALFPYAPAWRLEARFEPLKKPTLLPFPTAHGTVEKRPSPGVAVFRAGGREHRLVAMAEEGTDQLFFLFADETNRDETYGSGRELVAEAPVNGRVVLDFNRAYSPTCAFSRFSLCPLPPRQNRLALRVEAGEKRPAAPGSAAADALGYETLTLGKAPPTSLLVALHYSGSTPGFWKALLKDWEGATRVVLPRGPLPRREGFTWFAPEHEKQDAAQKTQDVERMAARVAALIREQRRAHPELRRVAVTGFSYGGDLAWVLAARYPELVDVAVPMGTRLLGEPSAARTARVHVLQGGSDAIIDAAATSRRVEALKAAGVPIDVRVFPGLGHDLSPELVTHWRTYLQQQLASPPSR